MPVIVTQNQSTDGTKIYYKLQFGRGAGERIATGIFTYTNPKDQVQKNHNKEALAILAHKQSQLTLDIQSGGTNFLTQHKAKKNFFDFYVEFVRKNAKRGNRSLECSLSAFRKFVNAPYIAAHEITENYCELFRDYLLQNLNGETPADYFMRFRRVLRAATKQGFFRENPATDVKAKSKPSHKKEIIDADEYALLLKAPCSNYEVKKAALFSLYTGLRWVDVSKLSWESIKEKTIVLQQSKTAVLLEIPLHPIAKEIAGERKTGLVFHLPTQDGANGVLKKWVRDAGINKHITWHSLRHSISVILQDNGTNTATVAGMLGHTTTKYVQKTYQRYKLDSAVAAVSKLPGSQPVHKPASQPLGSSYESGYGC